TRRRSSSCRQAPAVSLQAAASRPADCGPPNGLQYARRCSTPTGQCRAARPQFIRMMPMSPPSDRAVSRRVMKLIAATIDLLESIPLALPALVLRLGIALVFWRSGLTKLPLGNDMTIMLFEEEYRVPILSPALAAYVTTLIELVVPWMLIVGIG